LAQLHWFAIVSSEIHAAWTLHSSQIVMHITLTSAAVLLLTGIMTAGPFYCVDAPSAINVSLQKWMGLEYSNFELLLNSLYSAYSLPNLVLPFVGGLLIDRFDTKYILIAFTLIVCIGQMVFVIGVEHKLPWSMLLGRLIFGIGSETLEVGQADILNLWFGSNSLSFAMGLIVSFQRLVTTSMFNLSPYMVQHYSTPFAFKVGLFVCIAGFLSSILLAYLNQFAPTVGTPTDPDFETDSQVSIRSRTSVNSVDEELKADLDSPERILSANSAKLSLYEGNTIVILPDLPSPRTPSEDTDTLHQLREQLKFPPSFYYLIVITILTYGSVTPFIYIGAECLKC
jgi:MFS family permease